MSRRVLLILENAGAGSGRHVLDLARGLLQRGHHVTLVYSCSRLEGWFECESGNIDGLNAVTMDIRPGLGPPDVATIIRIRRLIRTAGPFDIVHGHSSKGGALARLGAIALPGACVYTPHAFYTLGAAPGSIHGRFYALLERVLARLSDAIICVSAAEHEHALSLGLPADRLFTVPNGLDVTPPAGRDAVRERLGLAEHHVCIGFVGRLARQKAVHRLLDSFALAHQAQPESRLVIVGSGPDTAALKAHATTLGIELAVVWTGAANGIQMMSAFDVFALPSLYEAFPYVFLEAMACRLPIVSMRVGGVDELVHENINGHVIEQGDTKTFGERLARLAGNAVQRHSMAEASAQIVTAFDTQRMVAATVNVYDEVAG